MHRTFLARLPLSTLLFVGTFALPGCIITIDDDFDTGNDELGDTGTTTQAETGTSTTTGDGDTTTGDGDTTTGDGDTTTESTTTDGDTTTDTTTDTTDTTTETTGGDGDCAPMDAVNGPEECFMPRGWFWNGQACEQIICTCEGSECNALFPNELACSDAYALCELGDPCLADDAFGDGMCDAFFGYAWDGNACVGVSGCNCVGLDCPSLPLDLGVCEAEHAQCGGNVPPCAGVMDAMGVGLCELFLGWKWNGMACEGVSGCSCEGLDCDFLYPELGICELESAGCL